MLLRVQLRAHADTRVHGNITATHVPGNVCVNTHAHGAHPPVRTREHPGTCTPGSCPPASPPPTASEPLLQFPAGGAQSHQGPGLGGGQRDTLHCHSDEPCRVTAGAHSLVEAGSDQGQSFTPRAETTARAHMRPGQQAGAAPRVCRGSGFQGQGQGLRGPLEDTCPILAREVPAVVCGGLPMAEGSPPPLGLSFPTVSEEVGFRQSESP